MNWEECRIRKFVKETKADEELIKSLLKTSEKKLITDKFSPVNEDTASTKFVVNYDSLREILEAVALKKGFKIYNHECFTGFLKEILNKELRAEEFDKFRRIRNAINYYGNDLTIENAKELINEITNLRSKLIKEFL